MLDMKVVSAGLMSSPDYGSRRSLAIAWPSLDIRNHGASNVTGSLDR